MRYDMIKRIDRYVGSFLTSILAKIPRRKAKIPEYPRILVIMFWGIGSNIYVLPCIREIKKRIPGSRITVLAPEKNKDLFYSNPDIDNLIFVDLDMKSLFRCFRAIVGKFDLCLDFEHWLMISCIFSYVAAPFRIGFGNLKRRARLYSQSVIFDPEKHALLNNLEFVKPLGNGDVDDSLVRIATSEESVSFVKAFIARNRITKKIVGICPGSGPAVPERRWKAERFAEIAKTLIEHSNMDIVFIGVKEEQALIESIQKTIPHTTWHTCGFKLGQTIAFVDQCSLIISNDTGPVHLGASQAIPTIGLYGPESPVIFGPYGPRSISLFKPAPGYPFIKIYEGSYKRPYPGIDCMKDISVDDVMGAVGKFLGKN
ncbi:MAG TPA: glycosyltransferase family 9 protein [Candidatus Nanoarchaeia archaeon]|nr:glycosyltransferase family 9 protein [Candidatus Nanoarchaeia archaeon]